MTERLMIVAATGVVYSLLFVINDWLLESIQLEFAAATHWIYLPSGLRLVFVLLFGFWGALGIATGSIMVGYFYYFQADSALAVGAGIISGLAPYLSRHICHRQFGLDLDLQNLNRSRLILIAALFALVSATMHQTFFTWHGLTDDFLSTAAVMAFGDFMGCILMLYLAKYLISKFKLG